MFDQKIGVVGFDASDLHDMRVERAIKFRTEGHDAAPIRIAAGRLRDKVGIGDILGNDAHATHLGLQPGCRDGERLDGSP